MRTNLLGRNGSRYASAILLTVVLVVYLLNASWLARAPTGAPSLLAHRGVHQLYDRAGLSRDACTATRMLPSTNPYLENTIPSMAASFALGADILELDIHPTTDRDFAVFHDWTLDCRTNGHGVTREHSMNDLKALDIGWSYTSDGGKTFPFRGKGVGMIPSLIEVLRRFPQHRFLLNFKSRWPGEADLLLGYLSERDVDIARQIMVYGDARPVDRWRQLTGRGAAFSMASVKACTVGYLELGWSTVVPEACRGGVIGVPIAWRHVFWGWPNRFLERMRKAGTEVILFGNVQGENGAPGITDPKDLIGVPPGFGGIVWADSIERIGPAWRSRFDASQGTPTPHVPNLQHGQEVRP
ncbi:glycerophosphodiester phosphodiesterase [Stakelama sp. CBK3Z-3]|uniref:Glycerophosphodiester phosphodiesterase n=1 Tax=Stakelama flava TaxID=2860338 RepID=A0ABS6XJM5_9SPHN|nr:glycerophosphodiester phosphodiesterase family protein [Stakelama flava]MBW4329655.1 glycerophosphodiester phosphodiesterase [Stakelama flava]